MTYDRTLLTLGQLLTSEDTTIKRNAMSILKTLTGCDHKFENGECIYCFRPDRMTARNVAIDTCAGCDRPFALCDCQRID